MSIKDHKVHSGNVQKVNITFSFRAKGSDQDLMVLLFKVSRGHVQWRTVKRHER